MKKIFVWIPLLLTFCLAATTACGTASRVVPQSTQKENERITQPCPDGVCPDNDCPDNDCPDGNCPDGNCPDNDCPDGNCPDNDCPDGDCPDNDIPLPPHMPLPQTPRIRHRLPGRRQIPIRPTPVPGPMSHEKKGGSAK